MITNTTPRPAVLIRAKGDTRTIEPREGGKFSLAEVQELVGGFVVVRHLPDGRLLLMNEEGKILGLAVNDVATVMDLNLAPGDAIVGNVVVCEPEQFP